MPVFLVLLPDGLRVKVTMRSKKKRKVNLQDVSAYCIVISHIDKKQLIARINELLSLLGLDND